MRKKFLKIKYVVFFCENRTTLSDLQQSTPYETRHKMITPKVMLWFHKFMQIVISCGNIKNHRMLFDWHRVHHRARRQKTGSGTYFVHWDQMQFLSRNNGTASTGCDRSDTTTSTIILIRQEYHRHWKQKQHTWPTGLVFVGYLQVMLTSLYISFNEFLVELVNPYASLMVYPLIGRFWRKLETYCIHLSFT